MMRTKLIALLAYVAFLCTFAYFALFVAGFAVPVTVDRGPAGPAWQAALIDLALVFFFGLVHSVMARAPVKRAMRAVVPEAAERSVYVLVASAQVALLCALWRPLPAVVYATSGPLFVVLAAVMAAGWITALASTFHIDHLALFGLRQGLGLPQRADGFATPGLYRVVRHPLYLGLLVALWVAPVMTVGHLVLAGAMTAYILVGVRHEERDLLRTFGDRYRAYQARVPMILPIR